VYVTAACLMPSLNFSLFSSGRNDKRSQENSFRILVLTSHYLGRQLLSNDEGEGTEEGTEDTEVSFL
jgi:hypothetical protein